MPRRKGVSPAMARAQLASARKAGKLSGSALGRLISRLGPRENAGEFAEWRSNPLTMLMIDVLRDLARNPGLTVPTQDVALVEYGVSSGFTVAADVLDDPSQVFDVLFADPTPEVGEHAVDGYEPADGPVVAAEA